MPKITLRIDDEELVARLRELAAPRNLTIDQYVEQLFKELRPEQLERLASRIGVVESQRRATSCAV